MVLKGTRLIKRRDIRPTESVDVKGAEVRSLVVEG